MTATVGRTYANAKKTLALALALACLVRQPAGIDVTLRLTLSINRLTSKPLLIEWTCHQGGK
jgi:hypothetical protein